MAQTIFYNTEGPGAQAQGSVLVQVVPPRVGQIFVDAMQLGFRAERNLDRAALGAPENTNLRTQGEAQSILGRPRVDVRRGRRRVRSWCLRRSGELADERLGVADRERSRDDFTRRLALSAGIRQRQQRPCV